MKRNNFNYLFGILFTVILSSCINDLDVVPIDPNLNTSDKVFVDVASYKQALAKLYASYALSGQAGNGAGDPDIAGIDEGFSNYYRQLWNLQELSTDEAIMAWNDATIKDLHYQNWTPTDVFVTALYSRIFYTVAICNEFVRTSGDKITDVTGDYQKNLQYYQAEARFLRAFSYWHAIDLFGNVPFVTEADRPGSYSPERIERAELFKYIESELIEIGDLLMAPKANEYGRVDQASAWMLLAKLYMNAEVYVGENRNDDAMVYVKKVIESAYQFDDNYFRMFAADNDQSPEIIFPITCDGLNTQSYGGSTYLLHAAYGGNMPLNGFESGWGGIRTMKEFAGLFGANESDYTTEEPTNPGIADKRGRFFFDPASWSWEVTNVETFTDGIGVMKFSNYKADGSEADNYHPTFTSTDVPVFRLSDVYLMYAELVLRGAAGGDKGTALAYVNKIRERAFQDANHAITDGELTLDFILDERARELYWEGHRRTDLIRFNKFTGGDYLWQWKGNVLDGKATDAYRNLYPIPENDLMANPNLLQNPGY
ncbi:MAG: RagB/SusD family nutrient uptake outer membrane protein [Prolixibacteraceae bacterium]